MVLAVVGVVAASLAAASQARQSEKALNGEPLVINYPGSDGRWIARDRPDDTELIIVHAPALR